MSFLESKLRQLDPKIVLQQPQPRGDIRGVRKTRVFCTTVNFRFALPPQSVDATQALNLSAGVSIPSVLRGRSFIDFFDLSYIDPFLRCAIYASLVLFLLFYNGSRHFVFRQYSVHCAVRLHAFKNGCHPIHQGAVFDMQIVVKGVRLDWWGEHYDTAQLQFLDGVQS